MVKHRMLGTMEGICTVGLQLTPFKNGLCCQKTGFFFNDVRKNNCTVVKGLTSNSLYSSTCGTVVKDLSAQ